MSYTNLSTKQSNTGRQEMINSEVVAVNGDSEVVESQKVHIFKNSF